ncbi:MAG: hypothetical protein ACE5G5_14640, partial [Candidatus Methylomirabilales bacterium]
GATFLNASLTESNIASNEVSTAKAFNTAEAGLELAKRDLKMSTASSLNGFLTGTTPGPYPFGDTPGAGNSFDGGNYVVQIYDNDDGDGNLNTDTDDLVFVESTGSYRGAQRRIVALVQIPLVPTPEGSVETIAPAGESELELEKGAVIDGNDWNPPADLSACTTIATCGTLTTNPAIFGASSNAIENEVEVKPPSTISSTQVNPGLSSTPWNNLADQLIGQADRNLSLPEILTGIHTWGTPSVPEITVISAPDIRIKDPTTVVNGAGILIINDLGELKLDHGTFNWQGLVIVRGNGKIEVEFDDDTDATGRIFGGFIMMAGNPDPLGDGLEIELEMENANSFIKYSSSAINNIRGFLPVTVQNWHEDPM